MIFQIGKQWSHLGRVTKSYSLKFLINMFSSDKIFDTDSLAPAMKQLG